MKNYTIYIVDDHQMFSEGLKKILESVEGYMVSKTFTDPEEALIALNFEPCDLLISDITMPKLNGIDFAKKVRGEFPKVKILILSMYNDGPYPIDAINTGVHGYMSKDSKADEIFIAIQLIKDGFTYISPRISANLLQSKKDSLELTPREIDVLQQIALGLNSHQIADKLFISPHTVETHRKNLLSKTGCTNSVNLSMWGVEKGHVKINDQGRQNQS